ncbi:MAG: HAMP domain-containing protein, partial [Verrucomicrobiae bacterium]|nr:HAMP domain-containing protein [Verrucomicrobiae bacterium]
MTTIRHRVLFALVITGIVPLTALLLLTDFMIGSAIRQSEEEKIANLNEAVAAHVSALMESAAEDLRAMQSNRFLSDPKVDSSERLQEMTRLVTVYDFISDLSVYDKKGFLMSSTTEDFPRYRDHSFTFKQAMEKREIEFSRPYREVGRADDQLFLSVYLPITNEESGALEHLVVARLNYSRVINLVQNVRPGSEGRIVLLDAWGNVLSSTNIKDSLAKFNDSLKVEKWVESPEGIYEDERGKRFLYHANVIGADKTQVQAPWVLVSLLPEEEINALLSRSQMGVLVVALGTLAMAGLIGWVISVRLSRPLVNLNEAAQKVAEGDLSVRAVAAGSVETTQLAGSFNQMVEELAEHRDGLERLVLSRTESLRRSQSELERTSARLQSAIDSTNNGFLVEDLEGGVAVVNQLFLDLIGFEGAKSSVQSAEAVLSIFGDHGEVLDGEFSSWNEAR